MFTEYVVGLLFSPDRNTVVLINKTKPDWQAGKLNGVGGKIEEGESPLNAKTYRDWETDRKSTRLNSSHSAKSRMPSSA